MKYNIDDLSVLPKSKFTDSASGKKEEAHCMVNSDHPADIVWVMSESDDPLYYCVVDFELILDDFKDREDAHYRLEGLTPEGKKILKENGIKEISPKKSEIGKKGTEEGDPIEKAILEYFEPNEYSIIPETQLTKRLKDIYNSSQILQKSYSKERGFLIKANKVVAEMVKKGEELKAQDPEKGLKQLRMIDFSIVSNENKQLEEYFYSEQGLNFKKTSKKFIIYDNTLYRNYIKWLSTQSKTGSGSPYKPIIIAKELLAEETPKSGEIKQDDWIWITTEGFPNLQGILNFYPQAKAYFDSKEVYISETFLRKILIAVEKDKPIILYGEPGDGKSLTTKTFLEWLCYEYNGGADPSAGGNPKPPINPFLQGINHDKGVLYSVMNVDESTNPLTLYGGYAPEALANPDKRNRRNNLEWGIISECVLKSKYCFLDELNRTENEVLGKLMGFLSEPFRYEFREGNYMVELKNPQLPNRKRSNMVIIGTMNVGDVGNFRMSSAFKRRFSVIKVHYDTQEISNLFIQIKGLYDKQGVPTPKKAKLFNFFKEICDPTRQNLMYDRYCEEFNQCLKDLSEYLYDATHQWIKDELTLFGVGVAHISAVLEDISINIKDLFYNQTHRTGYSVVSDLMDFNVGTPQNRTLLGRIIEDSCWENIIFALIDENDKFKTESMREPAENFIGIVSDHIKKLYMTILEPIDEKSFAITSPKMRNWLLNAWLFDNSIVGQSKTK